jgi:hypothetical protein
VTNLRPENPKLNILVSTNPPHIHKFHCWNTPLPARSLVASCLLPSYFSYARLEVMRWLILRIWNGNRRAGLIRRKRRLAPMRAIMVHGRPPVAPTGALGREGYSARIGDSASPQASMSCRESDRREAPSGHVCKRSHSHTR